MLESVDSSVASRAVDYIQLISNFPGERLPSDKRIAMYNKIANLDYFFPAILALENAHEVDRVSATRVAYYLSDYELRKRGTFTVVLFDAFFQVLLLVAFQTNTINFLDGQTYTIQHQILFYLALVSILYGIVRKLSSMSSTVKISYDVFANNNGRLVDWSDWLALIFSLAIIVWTELEVHKKSSQTSELMRISFAVSNTLVYLRVLAWLYVVNWNAR